VPRPAVRSAVWTEQWWESYDRLPGDRQASCDRVVMALIKGTQGPGLHVKPILPDKHYLEGRISSGDRVVFRVEGATIYFMDVVKHDDIDRYGRRPRQPR
jgi:mRNA-degrading endonuclease RelE of RelBE toxin-antitoxin system